MKTESDKVFVYGSLRRGYPLYGHLRGRGARFLGKGTVQARWVERSLYPGALPSKCSLDQIEGELYLLTNPSEDLKLLDKLEEVDLCRPENSLHVRHLSRIRLLTGQQFIAWAYFLPRKPPKRRLITDRFTSAGPLTHETKNR